MYSALFDSREDAKRAVHALRDHGISEKDISVLALADDGSGKVSNLEGSERVKPPGKDEGISTTTTGDAEKGAEEGAFVGAGLGLAAALASIFIPGFGFVAAGGALAAALGGAVIATVGGAVAGGVLGYLMDLGVPEHAARAYSEGIKQGGVLVSVQDTDAATPTEIQDIFTKYNGREAGSFPNVDLSAANAPTPEQLDAANRRLSGLAGGATTMEATDRALEREPTAYDAQATPPAVDVPIQPSPAPVGPNDARIGPRPGDPGASNRNLDAVASPPSDVHLVEEEEEIVAIER